MDRVQELENALREVLQNRDGQIVHRAALDRAGKVLRQQRSSELLEALKDCAAQLDHLLNGQSLPDMEEVEAVLTNANNVIRGQA